MTMSDKSPGRQLKEAREALGKDISRMAKDTRIKVQQLQGLENDNYESIPAPMYARGFIKIYAQELGLNPEPLLQKYEDIRNGVEPRERSRPVEKTPRPVEPADPDAVFRSPEAGTGGPPPSAPEGNSISLPNLSFLKDKVDMDALKSPRMLAGTGAGLLLVILLLGLRSCGKDSPAEGGPEALPEVEHPLLHEPGPVYFDLPRSLQ